MKRLTRTLAAGLAATTIVAASIAHAQSHDRTQKQTLFVGLDTSASFRVPGGWDDALAFIAYYIYGHLNGLGGLAVPRDLFVATIGGRTNDEPKAFHPIHDFAGKSTARIESDLRQWYPPTDTLTDFNAFFRQVARITKERNLQLSPINIMLVTDGVPDVASIKSGSVEAYRRIDLGPIEYLSRSVTVRLAYTSPTVGERWRTLVPRNRVRLWTVDFEVMRGWRTQMRSQAEPAAQDGFWKWVRENVDFRVRRGT